MSDQRDAPKRQLSLFDSTCLIVGIIIGAGIYQMTPSIAGGAACWWGVLLICTVGGLLSLCGALGYAELATAYPRAGGDYVYLTRAYGRWAGFLFGWLQLAVVRPGDIAVMAFAFALYARAIFDPFAGTEYLDGQRIYAILAVVVLTAVNMVGVPESKWTQNLLTVVKALGLLAIVGVAVLAPRAAVGDAAAAPLEWSVSGLSVALILVLFTFGGWNEMAYVAAEVKNPDRNIVRALVLGTAAVTVLYLLANGAFLWTLGYDGVVKSEAVATDAVSVVFPRVGANLVSALICISALGAVNGLIFTGARISYAVGADHVAFRGLGKWNSRTGTPVRALLLQALIAVVLISTLGSFVETIIYTAPTVYTFYLATSLAVIVLRFKEPGVNRPYRVLGYPFTPLIFSGVCIFLIYKAVEFSVVVLDKPWIAVVPCVSLLLGLPIYWMTTGRNGGSREE